MSLSGARFIAGIINAAIGPVIHIRHTNTRFQSLGYFRDSGMPIWDGCLKMIRLN
jgi:hypothetical protein